MSRIKNSAFVVHLSGDSTKEGEAAKIITYKAAESETANSVREDEVFYGRAEQQELKEEIL